MAAHTGLAADAAADSVSWRQAPVPPPAVLAARPHLLSYAHLVLPELPDQAVQARKAQRVGRAGHGTRQQGLVESKDESQDAGSIRRQNGMLSAG